MGLQTTLIYMVAGLVFQISSGKPIVDLKESFYAHRRWFSHSPVAIIATSVCKHLLLDGKAPKPTILVFYGLFGVTLFIGALTRRSGIIRH